MLDKIELLREKLNKRIEENRLNDDETIKLSQELDILIVEYYNSIGYTNKESLLPENENDC